MLSDVQLAAINADIAAGRPPAMLYLGPDGRSQRMAIRRHGSGGRKLFTLGLCLEYDSGF